MKTTAKIVACLVPVGVFAVGWRIYQKTSNDRDGLVSGLVALSGTSHDIITERTAPDGTRYSVDTTLASYRLETLPEDEHARHVFPNYADALRYARAHQLPTIPSVSLVLASCSATDHRLQTTLELSLDADPQTGRRALIHQWLSAVLEFLRKSRPGARPACDRAIDYLATAAFIQGGPLRLPPELSIQPNPAFSGDPPLGPWAENPELGVIWRRDRFLARGVPVDDDVSAAAVAVLARTQPAAWQKHRAVARVLHGKPTRPTFESIAKHLAGLPDEALTGPEAVGIVRAAASGPANPAPAALAFAPSPEQEWLEALGMRAWDDPVGALMAGIRSGKITLKPGSDVGFYRRRWFALETLAAPNKAPETHKLQLSADYRRRRQRAFAAGFAEGRSGFVKRLPVAVMGIRYPGKKPLDVAPQFSAEPAPIVYLRLARAYRMLADGLSAADARWWSELRTADGQTLAPELERQTRRLYGLAAKVYREVGCPPPLLKSEAGLDLAAAESATEKWLAGLENDPGVTRDARLLVGLATDGHGSYRCPAILGVRLEPVKYSWVEEPEVNPEIDPTFVPARYWLASPIPATVTVRTIPTPAEFRRQCDGHADVASLCRAFGQDPPKLYTPPPARWPWILAAMVLLGAAFPAILWWRRRTKRTRRMLAGGIALVLAIPGGAVILHPPLWLLRWSWLRLADEPPGIVAALERPVKKWIGDRRPDLFISLLRDPAPQARYSGAMLDLFREGNAPALRKFTADEMALIRLRVDDEIPEVGYTVWQILCREQEELPFLLDELSRTTTPANADMRLYFLEQYHNKKPEVIEAVLELTKHPNPEVRAKAARHLARWRPPVSGRPKSRRANDGE